MKTWQVHINIHVLFLTVGDLVGGAGSRETIISRVVFSLELQSFSLLLLHLYSILASYPIITLFCKRLTPRRARTNLCWTDCPPMDLIITFMALCPGPRLAWRIVLIRDSNLVMRFLRSCLFDGSGRSILDRAIVEVTVVLNIAKQISGALSKLQLHALDTYCWILKYGMC